MQGNGPWDLGPSDHGQDCVALRTAFSGYEVQ